MTPRTRSGLAVLVLVCVPASAQPVTKEKFLTMFEVAAPSLVCNDKSYIIRCYGHSQSKCLEAALPIAKDCVRSRSGALPDLIDRSQIGEIAEAIGKCVEDGMRVKLNLPPTDDACRQ